MIATTTEKEYLRHQKNSHMVVSVRLAAKTKPHHRRSDILWEGGSREKLSVNIIETLINNLTNKNRID